MGRLRAAGERDRSPERRGGTQLVAAGRYTYDAVGQLTGLKHFTDAVTVADYEWTYDAAGRMETMGTGGWRGGSGVPCLPRRHDPRSRHDRRHALKDQPQRLVFAAVAPRPCRRRP